MYFVDRERIEAMLQFMNKQIAAFEKMTVWDSVMEQAALERFAHTIIEAILDVGNAMIDGFIMRDPGSYDDIIDILLDEKVIDQEMSDGLKSIISLRPELVQEYIDVNHQQVQQTFLENVHVLKDFAPKVNHYLEKELGPVSAFKK